MKRGICLLFILVVFMLSLSFAGSFHLVSAFNPGKIGNDTSPASYIESDYSPGDYLRGYINVSLDDSAGIVLEDNLGNRMNLSAFLEENQVDYECVPVSCSSNFELTDESVEKNFAITSGQKKLLGLKVSGNNIDIKALGFDINSNAGESCDSQIKIDFFRDNSINWMNEKGKDDSCSINHGCFNLSDSNDEVRLGLDRYCELISVSEKPGLFIGGVVKKGIDANVNITMQLYDENDNFIEECNAPAVNPGESEIGCSINYSVRDTENLSVCIFADKESDYTIKIESKNVCGFYINPGNEEADYNLFIKGLKYDSIGKVRIDNSVYENFNEESLLIMVNDFISQMYNGNCTNGCAVPFELISKKDQNIILNNVSLSYSTSVGTKFSDKSYYATETPANIKSDYLILDLSKARFSVGSSGNKTLILKLDEEEIGRSDINIGETIITGLYPLKTGANTRTNFIALTIGNITEYKWNFGDESTTITGNKGSVEHIYSQIGKYDLTLEVTHSSGKKAVKIFKINVVSPRDYANNTIKLFKARLSNITANLKSFGWFQDYAEELLGFNNLKSDFEDAEDRFKKAVNDSDYSSVMAELTEINMPEKINSSMKSSLPIIVGVDEIDIISLSALGAEKPKNYSEKEYQNSIWNWMQNYVDGKIDYEIISVYRDTGNQELLTKAKLILKLKNSNYTGDFYIVINTNPDKTRFSEDYREKDLNGVVGIKLSDLKNIEFVVEGKQDFINKIYISPEFSKLEFEQDIKCNKNEVCEADLGENWRNCRNDCKPWRWVITLVIIVLVVAFAAYLVLNRWYKLKYERYLFKDRNDLYNIVNFVNNALFQGLDKGEIINRLEKFGWKREQINYVMKRIKGKQVQMPGGGMFDKVLEKFSKKKEAEKIYRKY